MAPCLITRDLFTASHLTASKKDYTSTLAVFTSEGKEKLIRSYETLTTPATSHCLFSFEYDIKFLNRNLYSHLNN